MMLKDQINSDLKQSLKNKESFLVDTLRFLNAAIKNRELEKRAQLSKTISDVSELERQSVLTDEEVLDVALKECKKRKESIVEFEKANRLDLAEKEKSELNILKKYLPEEMSEEELKNIVLAIAGEIGKDSSNFGKIMSETMKKIKGRAGGDAVSKIVKEILNN